MIELSFFKLNVGVGLISSVPNHMAHILFLSLKANTAKNVQSKAEVTISSRFHGTLLKQSLAKLLKNSTASMHGADNLGILTCLEIPAKTQS